MVGSWGKPAGVASTTAKTDSATACACRRQLAAVAIAVAAAGWAPRVELIDQAARACRGHGCLDPLISRARADQAARARLMHRAAYVLLPDGITPAAAGFAIQFGVRLLPSLRFGA